MQPPTPGEYAVVLLAIVGFFYILRHVFKMTWGEIAFGYVAAGAVYLVRLLL